MDSGTLQEGGGTTGWSSWCASLQAEGTGRKTGCDGFWAGFSGSELELFVSCQIN